MDIKSAMRKRNNSQSAENPRGKKRKQREHADNKLARVAREEAREEHNKQPNLYFEEKCTLQSCGSEQACMVLNETHNYCLCYFDGRPSVPGDPCHRTAYRTHSELGDGLGRANVVAPIRGISMPSVRDGRGHDANTTMRPSARARSMLRTLPESVASDLYFEEKCTLQSCGSEQACTVLNETHNYCLCYFDGRPSVPGDPCHRTAYRTHSELGDGLGRANVVAPIRGIGMPSVRDGRGHDANTTMRPSARARSMLRTLPESVASALYFEEKCTLQSCGSEQACMVLNETHNFCLCTSDGRPVMSGNPCPRTALPTLHANPIHGVRPPMRPSSAPTDIYASSPPTEQVAKSVSGEFHAETTIRTDTRHLGTSGDYGTWLSLTVLAGCGALLIIVLPALIWYLRRRICKLNGKTKPRVRTGEPLLAERYITNPQYGVYGSGPPPVTPADDTNEPQVPLLDRHALTFLEEVGEGCFGKVHKGLLRASSGELVVAIKVLKESASRSAEEDFVREVSIMSAFRHDNILTLVGAVYRNDISASPWMVFEYMEWGDLAGVLRGSRGGGRPGPTLDEPALLHVAIQVARGMQYLASRRFVHRDLAARNCLVGSNLTVKIADFGMSRDVYTCDYYKMGGERPMPVRWMSPESIVYARFTHESDVWSYGVVLWEIYSRGKQPFYGHNNDGATRLILQGIVLVPPEECPRFACELMRACWQSDPRDRINFEEICRKLEVAAESQVESMQVGLPRPPLSPTPQDSAGYLIPARQPPVDYLTLSLPEPEGGDSSESSEEEEEYT